MEVGGAAGGFRSLGLSHEACDAIQRIRFGKPPGGFLSMSLPRLISGADLKCMLQESDRSKTMAAYLVTIFEKFNNHRGGPEGGVRALILTATSDMASRTFECAQKLFSSTDIVVVLLDGGESDLERLGRKKPVAVIVTPDTLIQHLFAAADGIMSLRTVELLVIDGAYEMLRLGFADHLNQILGQLVEDRQTLLFTTQLTAEVCDFAQKILSPHHFVVIPSRKYAMMLEKISSLTLGQEQPCVGQPNNLQGSCPPPLFNAKMKKRATPDWMEEAGRFKKRADISMDID